MYFANNFFQNIFQGYNTACAAKFIYHYSKVNVFLPEIPATIPQLIYADEHNMAAH